MACKRHQAIQRIDDANRKDPRTWTRASGEEEPYELAYAKKLSEWVEKLEPNPSEELILAARALHIERWTVPRSLFPMDRESYHEWKELLREVHSKRAGEIMTEVGYDSGAIERVRRLIDRSAFPDDPESRVIEDAVSLLFLESQFTELAEKTERRKMIRILQRVWAKLTPKAQETALRMEYADLEAGLLKEALEA